MQAPAEIRFEALSSEALVPPAWREDTLGGAFVFNPTITAQGDDGYAMVYRVVGVENRWRRLASCLLDRDFAPVPGSVTPLSDLIAFADAERLNERSLAWHADARWFTLLGRRYLSWNDGANRPVNAQFLMEMADDGITPAGPAREIVIDGPRRTIEKNWMFFDDGHDVWCVYSIAPHTVLAVDLSDPTIIRCAPSASVEWEAEYQDLYGVMRGGAQPIRRGDRFLSLIHSSYKMPAGQVYEACFYEFEAAPPFRPLRAPTRPMPLPHPGQAEGFGEQLNSKTTKVVYPCGVVCRDDNLVISYGVDDLSAAVAVLPAPDALALLKPVAPSIETRWSTPATPITPPAMTASRPTPLFWWDAAGKKFDGPLGSRTFGVGNFGDIASRDIVERVSGSRTRNARVNERKLIAVGSVAHVSRPGDVIWGSGVKGTKRQLDPGMAEVDVRAVRGPLSADALRTAGADLSRVTEVFDPGCLMPKLFAEEMAAFNPELNASKGPVRIIPHYRDDLLMRRSDARWAESFLTVDCTPLDMLLAMLGAEAIISSSLHGLIFAESLGLPAYWLRSVGGEDSFKFYDYYYSTGRYNVRCFDSIDEALASKPMAPPKFRFDDYLATFPFDVMGPLNADGASQAWSIEFAGASLNVVSGVCGFDPASVRPGAEGLWLTKSLATLSIPAPVEPETALGLKVTLRPFNPPHLPSPQHIRIRLGEGREIALSWAEGDISPRTVILPISGRPDASGDMLLQIQATHAESMRRLGVNRSDEVMAVCLRSMALVPLIGAQ
jgi:pyruvyltransferase